MSFSPAPFLVLLRQTLPTSFGFGIGAPGLPPEDLAGSAVPHVAECPPHCSSRPWFRKLEVPWPQDAAVKALQAPGPRREVRQPLVAPLSSLEESLL